MISFTYDNNNRVVRVDITYDDFVERTIYVYNSSGQVTRVNYSYSSDPGVFVEESYTTYQCANTTTRNPRSATEFSYDGLTAFEEGTSVFEYDDKRSFASASPVLASIFGFFSENNVTRETYTGEFGDSYVGTFTYQYNAQGYPTSITEQFDNDDTNTVTLAYDCR